MESTPSDEKAKSFERKTIEKKSFIPKSLSVIDMMKLGKLIQIRKELIQIRKKLIQIRKEVLQKF